MQKVHVASTELAFHIVRFIRWCKDLGFYEHPQSLMWMLALDHIEDPNDALNNSRMRIEGLMCNVLRADPFDMTYVNQILASAAALGNPTLVMINHVWYHFRKTHVDLTRRRQSAIHPKDYKYMSVLAAECAILDLPSPWAADEKNVALGKLFKNIYLVAKQEKVPPAVMRRIEELKAAAASVPAPVPMVVSDPLPIPSPSRCVEPPPVSGSRGKRAAAASEAPEENSKLDLDTKKQRKFASNLVLFENVAPAPSPAPATPAEKVKTKRCRDGNGKANTKK